MPHVRHFHLPYRFTKNKNIYFMHVVCLYSLTLVGVVPSEIYLLFQKPLEGMWGYLAHAPRQTLLQRLPPRSLVDWLEVQATGRHFRQLTQVDASSGQATLPSDDLVLV